MPYIGPEEEYYLSCILLAIEKREWQAPFDHLFKRWWAVGARPGGIKVHHPDWALSSSGVTPDRFDFVSSTAARILTGFSGRLQIAPAVPDFVLRDFLMESGLKSINDVQRELKRWCRFGALADEDLARIAEHGLASSMPATWPADRRLFARFEAAGIVVQETGTSKPSTVLARRGEPSAMPRTEGKHSFLSSAALPVHAC